ncbi:hypothetical protein LCGC14_0946080 [marine sediment metagenome]|uniref:Uncharacterized protein n=1 Tax=marine sediment metagenome TaxID=412755 RepID=A0A0F9P4R7_9ZZZZ
MLNFECVDKREDGFVELCFTDSEGDEAVKVIVSKKTAWDIAKKITDNFCYATTKKRKEVRW